MKAIVPAFGQRLMRARFAGWHPLFVALTVGEDWSAFAKEPFVGGELACLALRPKDVRQPHAIDFRCLAGSAVTVYDQVGAACERAAPIGSPHESERAPFFDLLNAVAQFSGPLSFVTAAPIYNAPLDKPPHQVMAQRYAFECKLADAERRSPWWWPESMDKPHAEKIAAWCAAARNRAAGPRGHVGAT